MLFVWQAHSAENAVFLIDSTDTSPCAPASSSKSAPLLRSPYPAGDGSAAIFRSMPGKQTPGQMPLGQ